MRNDARPVGEASPASPVGGDASPGYPDHGAPDGASDGAADDRDSVADDRQSHIVHKETENRQPETPDDSVTPQSGSTPTKA